jgi:hypothetical protein
MNGLTTLPCASITFAAAAWLVACTPAGSDEGETGETGDSADSGDNEACIDPGTELLPGVVKPAVVPMPETSVMYTCTTGWGTDAPRLAPEWTVQVGQPTTGFDYVLPAIAAHPDGGVVMAAMGELSHHGTDGGPLWTNELTTSGQVFLAVEQAGTILLGVNDWIADQTSLNRYNADGTPAGEIIIPWNSSYPNLWAVTTYGTDIVIGANDEDGQGSYESTLIRLDVDGNLLLRKSTSQSGGNLLAVTDGGVALFGSFPGFLVALEDGAVLGMLTPSSGAIGDVIGVGDNFITTGNVNNATGDLGIGRYSSAGVEQWLQSYDRATLVDVGEAVAVGGDGNFVVVGATSLLDSTDAYLFFTQPVVFGVDADGNALWTDRIAAHADASAVAIGVDGDVYVAGTGDSGIGIDPNTDESTVVAWLRRYVP